VTSGWLRAGLENSTQRGKNGRRKGGTDHHSGGSNKSKQKEQNNNSTERVCKGGLTSLKKFGPGQPKCHGKTQVKGRREKAMNQSFAAENPGPDP